jgi:hypothetical protein
MTKTLNQIIFFSLHQNQNIFLEKNHNPPFKWNGPSTIFAEHAKQVCILKKIHLKTSSGTTGH